MLFAGKCSHSNTEQGFFFPFNGLNKSFKFCIQLEGFKFLIQINLLDNDTSEQGGMQGVFY